MSGSKPVGGGGSGGTVTSVGSGTGLTGGPITSSGTLALATIADQRLFGNYSGGALAPQALQLIAGANITFSATTTSLTLTASTGTGSGITSIVAGAGLSGGTITTSGTIAVIIPPIPQGRLTLTSATPVLTSTVTGSTTVYYALYNGNYVPIYDGTNFVPTAFTELSQATTDNTKSPAAVANNSNYDLFVWNDAATIRCTRGPAWTSDTGRGTGAATTELERVNGILVNKISIANGPAAQRGTYVGTIRTNGSSQVDMIFGGAGAAGGEDTALNVWNMYNRVGTPLINFDNTDNWNYTINTYRVKNGDSSNRISMVIGLSDAAVRVVNSTLSSNTSANISRLSAIGLNSESTVLVGSSVAAGAGTGSTSQNVEQTANYIGWAPLGFNYFAPLERSAASGTTTWRGDDGGAINYAVFMAEVQA